MATANTQNRPTEVNSGTTVTCMEAEELVWNLRINKVFAKVAILVRYPATG